MSRIIDPLEQFFDDAGDPLVDGLLYFYETGTNTALDTFSDVNLVNVNPNPLPLTAAGRCPNAYGYNRLYRVVLKTSADVQILQRDNVGSFAAEGAFSAWIFDKTYSKDEIVTYNAKFYRSAVNSNTGNAPDSTTQWVELDLPEKYSSTVTYTQYKLVYDAGSLYVSTQPANIGNAPATTPNYWQRVNGITLWGANTTYRQYELAIDSSGVVQQSQQNGNLNHTPIGDSGAWWKPLWQVSPALAANYLSGGGNLSAYRNNVLTDAATYTLPPANSVPANAILVVSMLDTHKGFQPLVQRAGSDLIRRAAGTDTAMLMQQAQKISLTLVSNGVDEWRI